MQKSGTVQSKAFVPVGFLQQANASWGWVMWSLGRLKNSAAELGAAYDLSRASQNQEWL
jgi:hypothetical protein